MATVSFRRGSDWDEVEIEVHGGSTGLASEVGYLLLSRGAEPRGDKFVISSLDLRLSASELAAVLKRHSARPEYDPQILQLLNAHVEEVRAREAADASEVLPHERILNRLQKSRFGREFTESQIRDLSRLLVLRHGANFSVPGAGKTTTLLAIYETLRASGETNRLLVVAPKNAFLAWEDESELCFRRDKPVIRRLTGGYDHAQGILAEDPEICLITYQFLPHFLRPLMEWTYRHRTHIVLDESHRVKAGAVGVVAGAALGLSGAGVRRDILSGTPMPQSPEDLRPQLQFLWPGQRILPDNRVGTEASEDVLSEIQHRVGPLYVRTTKKELELPDPDIRPISVELGPVQRELYELLRSEARRLASGMTSRDRAYFRLLGRHVVRLLEAASNPMLLTQGPMIDDEEGLGTTPQGAQAFDLLREFSRYEKPAKVMAAVQRTERALLDGQQPKVLIWTSFIQNVLLLEKLLAKFNPVVLYGAIGTGDEQDPETREWRIRKFHSDSTCRVMIANPAACGEGISLHQACHYAIYLDRTFNAAHYLQSLDRIHRLGMPQGVTVRVEVLEARWTIDIRVAKRLQTKISAMSRILNDPGLAALAYDPEDVIEEYPGGLEPDDVEEVVDHLTESREAQ